MRSITFSLWASTAVISSRRTCTAFPGPVACDNKFGLSYLIPQVSLLAKGTSRCSLRDHISKFRRLTWPPLRTHSHARPGTQISTSPWARRDPSSASLTRVQEIHSSIRTSGPVPALPGACSVLTAYYFLFFIFFSYRIFIVLFTRRQQWFGGNLPGTWIQRIRRLSLVARQTPLRFGFSD